MKEVFGFCKAFFARDSSPVQTWIFQAFRAFTEVAIKTASIVHLKFNSIYTLQTEISIFDFLLTLEQGCQ